MGIDPEKWERVNATFEQALREPSSRRQSFVEATADEKIRAEVQRLLRNHDGAEADRFLSNGPSPEPDDDETSFVPMFSPGDLLAARFRILRYPTVPERRCRRLFPGVALLDFTLARFRRFCRLTV